MSPWKLTMSTIQHTLVPQNYPIPLRTQNIYYAWFDIYFCDQISSTLTVTLVWDWQFRKQYNLINKVDDCYWNKKNTILSPHLQHDIQIKRHTNTIHSHTW